MMNTLCPSCLATNRVPNDNSHDHHSAKCGRCGHPLFNADVVQATEQTFDKFLNSDLPIIVDFWAPWCSPCLNFAPIFEAAAKQYAGKVRFIKINTDAQPELSARFRIRSIPSLMFFTQGTMRDMQAGALPQAVFCQWLDSLL
jgi:thioredoxin 2